MLGTAAPRRRLPMARRRTYAAARPVAPGEARPVGSGHKPLGQAAARNYKLHSLSPPGSGRKAKPGKSMNEIFIRASLRNRQGGVG